jgi:DNA polymerase-1
MVLVDGNLILNKILHLPSFLGLKNREGMFTGGVYGFLKSLQPTLDRLCGSSCVVVWDGGKSRRRKTLFPGYKAHRVKPEGHIDIFLGQQTLIDACLNCLGVGVVRLSGREADDILGFLARELEGPNVIVSDDEDFLQCVSSKTSVYRTRSGKSVLLTEENFSEIMGFDHDRFLLYKCMVGDKSDGIEGVTGIGPVLAKRAVNSLRAPCVEELYLRYSGSKVPVRERKISEGIETVKRNLELIDVSKEVFSEEERKVLMREVNRPKGCDMPSIIPLFQAFDFNQILSSLSQWTIPFRRLK